jgi:hypothetical protein
MPGWLWFVIAIALGVVIYLLLRGVRIGGRRRAPAIEYITPEGETVVEPAAEDQVEPVLPTTIAAQPDDADDAVRLEEAQAEEAVRAEADEAEKEEKDEELAEDAELRHDEGYVETFGNERAQEPAAFLPAGEVRESEYGEGTAQSGRRGIGPEGWTVKGNADSMLFYTDDAPSYRRTSADVWFESEEAATKAGFTRWDAHHR